MAQISPTAVEYEMSFNCVHLSELKGELALRYECLCKIKSEKIIEKPKIGIIRLQFKGHFAQVAFSCVLVR